jgi:hypothetical protein
MSPKTLLSVGVILLTLFAGAVKAAAANPSIVIDGAKLPADVPALVSGAHVLVPFRDVFEDFGALVSFDEVSGLASATLGQTTVVVQVGSSIARINGEAQTMEAPATELAGRVMVPLHLLSKSLGISVAYEPQSNMVVIVTGRRPGNFAAYAGGPTFESIARVAPSVEGERPASGELVGSQYPSIYARFNGGTSPVNPSTVQIQVDGMDVSDQATISSAYVSYTPQDPLADGLHNVTVTGQADDGTPFTESWSFRVDAGSASDYTVGTYGGAGFGAPALGFGWPWFHRFGFFPPGFSVFTPGPLFFVSGGVVEVIFFNRFFPFGNAFFTISGCPGEFPLTPWLGNPGFFWGFMQVPFGLQSRHAVIAAHFTLPNGRHVVVHSTAPIDIEGEHRSLPPNVAYAVMPRLVDHPRSLHQAVSFQRVIPAAPHIKLPAFSNEPSEFHSGAIGSLHIPEQHPIFTHIPATVHVPIVVRPAMPAIRPAMPVMRPAPLVIPAFHAPAFHWQGMPAVRAPVKPH